MNTFKQYLLEEISQRELDDLEKILDSLWRNLNIDIEFTRHFFDRLNDMRNKTPITIDEVSNIFKKTFEKFGDKISSNIQDAKMGKDIQSVLFDIQSKVNIPFVLVWNKRKKQLDLISKTILRKKNFQTSNPKFRI